MNFVWHDDYSDQIRIASGARSQDYAARSLVVMIDSGLIAIRLRNSGDNVLAADWTLFGDKTGNSFASADDLVAYLTGEFSKKQAIGEAYGIPVVAGDDLQPGMPIALSRATGMLLPARADTYTLAFVAGLASVATAQGFVTTPVRGAVTLADWTDQTGKAALHVGVPYFLAPEGGLTISPFGASGFSSVRVGTALTPTTLGVAPSDPILF